MNRRAAWLLTGIISLSALHRLVCGASLPEAQAGTPERWSRARCLQLAYVTNLEVTRSLADIHEAQCQVDERSANRFAPMELQGLAVRLPEDKAISTPFMNFTILQKEIYQIQLSMNQPLYTGGALSNAHDAARKGFEAVKSKHGGVLNEIRFRVTKAYFALANAEALHEVAQQSLAQVEAHRRDVQNLFIQGVLLRNEVLKVEVRRSQAQSLVQAAETAKGQAQVALLQTMGLPQQTTVLIDAAVEFHPIELSAPEIVAEALAGKPEITALQQQIEAAHLAAKATKASYYPTLAATGSYVYGQPGDLGKPGWSDSWTLGLTAKYTVVDWGKRRSQSDKADIIEERLRIDLERLKQAIAADIERAALAVSDAARRVELSQTEQQQAEENFKLTANLISQGMATNTDFLDAENAVTRARMNRVQAIIDHYQAVNDLEHASGATLLDHGDKSAVTPETEPIF